MATAERMAESMRIEQQGVFVLLWDAKEDLVRALVVLTAALPEIPPKSLLLTASSAHVAQLRRLVESRTHIDETPQSDGPTACERASDALWILFLQQASYNSVGPLLNG